MATLGKAGLYDKKLLDKPVGAYNLSIGLCTPRNGRADRPAVGSSPQTSGRREAVGGRPGYRRGASDRWGRR